MTMADLTPMEQLEPHRWYFLPVREFKPGAPLEGSIVCTRLDGNFSKPDALGDLGSTCVELVTDEGRQLLPRPIVRHSPTGFEWGYGGSGPSDLAANCLAVVLPLSEAWRLHHKYKAWAIAQIPQEGGELSVRAIRLWIEDQWREELADTNLIRQEESRRLQERVMEIYDSMEKRELAGETIPQAEWEKANALERQIAELDQLVKDPNI
jgi:hypothetical protein